MYVKHGEGGVFRPPRKKTLKLGIGLKSMLKAQFFMDSSMKKNYTDNFNSLGAREDGKCLKKGQKKEKNIFFLF